MEKTKKKVRERNIEARGYIKGWRAGWNAALELVNDRLPTPIKPSKRKL